MSNEISIEDMMIHILNNLPEEYDTIVEAMERNLDYLVDSLTLRNLKNELMLIYNRIKKNILVSEDSENNEEGQDTARVGYTKNFKGRCYYYDEFGHKKDNCPKLRNQTSDNKSGRFNGTCFYCEKRGHMKSKCRKLKKRLEEMKSKTTNIHQENENRDVILMSHEEKVPTCKEISEYQDNEMKLKVSKNKFFL